MSESKGPGGFIVLCISFDLFSTITKRMTSTLYELLKVLDNTCTCAIVEYAPYAMVCLNWNARIDLHVLSNGGKLRSTEVRQAQGPLFVPVPSFGGPPVSTVQCELQSQHCVMSVV